MSRPQEDGIVRYGDHVSLKHVMTGRFLTSEEDFYEGGSGQQKIFAGGWEAQESSTWIVIPPIETEEERGYEVGWDDLVRLKHVPTRANLHSHEIPSPVTEQQEVSCFGNDGESDNNDLWRVKKFYEDGEDYDDFWRVDQPFVLQHVETGNVLHSHEHAFGEDSNEVTAYPEGDDENNKWIVAE
ncbi:MIR motif-containing protein [Phycomyces nitens]|nr:MIR motif-containing protein [Phycomyces nitens]